MEKFEVRLFEITCRIRRRRRYSSLIINHTTTWAFRDRLTNYLLLYTVPLHDMTPPKNFHFCPLNMK